MQAPLLDGRRHQKTAEEEEICLQKVLDAHFLGWEDSQSGEKADGEHGGDSQGESLGAPEDGHQQNHVKTFPLLQQEKENDIGKEPVQGALMPLMTAGETWDRSVARTITTPDRSGSPLSDPPE